MAINRQNFATGVCLDGARVNASNEGEGEYADFQTVAPLACPGIFYGSGRSSLGWSGTKPKPGNSN